MSEVDKLTTARCRLMASQPWYGSFAMGMEWIKSDRIDTMGVRIINGGTVQCLWSPNLVDKMTVEELCVIVQHEIEHIVRLHCVRVESREHDQWNIAADMCINGQENDPRIGIKVNTGMVFPDLSKIFPPREDGEKVKAVFIPKDWPNNLPAEQYYDKIMEDCKRILLKVGGPGQKGKGQKGKGQNGQGQGQPGDEDGDGEGQPGQGESETAKKLREKFGSLMDDHSTWQDSDVSAEEARQIVVDMVNQASERSQGHVPGHLADAVAKLQKPIVRWREELRKYVGNHVGNRRSTMSRQSRRRQLFGTPGYSHHNASKITVIVDTSGSVSQRDLQQFFSEIDAMSYKSKVSILQWDHAFQGYTPRYRRGDWKKLVIKGRGGTDMEAPVEWLVKNNAVGDVVIMLTDGYANYAKKKAFPYIVCLTCEGGSRPDWGKVLEIYPQN